MKITNYNKIAIFNTAYLGDIILSFFLAQEIKNIHPQCKITFVTTPNVKDLIPLIKAIDYVLFYDKRKEDRGYAGFSKIIAELKKNKFDILFVPHRSLRSTLISFLSKPIISVSFLNSSLSFLYSKRVEYLFHQHEIERNLELLTPFDEFKRGEQMPKVEITFPENFAQNIHSKTKLNFNSNKTVSIAPGSVWKTKQWTIDGFTKVAKILSSRNYQVVLIGGESDFELCKHISEESNSHNLAGKLTLGESLFIIKSSELLITNDSSPTHLATLAGCPTITIYGPTIPEFGFYPRAPRSKVVQLDNLGCRPCSMHGYNECPLGHHKCMKEISAEEVLSAAQTILDIN
ncbi:MAG: glycosyltransferase family 9 protein [Candidatus Kapaibacteriota bacterium]